MSSIAGLDNVMDNELDSSQQRSPNATVAHKCVSFIDNKQKKHYLYLGNINQDKEI